MDNQPTPLQQLLTPALELDNDAIAAASDDTLRAAVVQAIDALERMSELGELVVAITQAWGTPSSSDTQSFDRFFKEREPTDPVIGGLPDRGCVLALRPGESIEVASARREDLVAGLSSLHTSLRRYDRVSQMMVQSAQAACRGEYVQSEFDKDDYRPEPVLQRPPGPR